MHYFQFHPLDIQLIMNPGIQLVSYNEDLRIYGTETFQTRFPKDKLHNYVEFRQAQLVIRACIHMITLSILKILKYLAVQGKRNYSNVYIAYRSNFIKAAIYGGRFIHNLVIVKESFTIKFSHDFNFLTFIFYYKYLKWNFAPKCSTIF